MANNNTQLGGAKRAKKDEFYTQLSDIERELGHYREHFRGKVVLCNCDDPYESNFFKYFCLQFNSLGLRKLICTCYNGSPVANQELSLKFVDTEGIAGEEAQHERRAYKVEINEIRDYNGDGAVDMTDVEWLLRNDHNISAELQTGDFRSPECVELLKQADIVCTNPPFSLFRQYVAQLMKYEKKFLIIGNINAVTYKEIFPLVKNNKIWLGPSITSGDRKFYVPDYYPLNASGSGIDKDPLTGEEKKYIKVKGVRWFTNLDHKKRHEEVDLYRRYNPNDYPRYDNYDAIEIGKTSEIPYDYDGLMGVPISFLDKYDPDQFEIKGFAGGWNGHSDFITRKYPSKQIQHNKDGKIKIVGKMNDGTPQIKIDEPPINKTYYTINDGKFYVRTYGRILIQKKQNTNYEDNSNEDNRQADI